jgi:hypothetical protein
VARRFGLTIDCADPAALAGFWAEVLDRRPGQMPADDAPPEERAYAVLEAGEDGQTEIYFQRVPEGKVAKNRVHLDVRVGGEGELAERRARVDAEAARLVALGASDHRGAIEEGGYYWIRLNDPEGNEFCLV